MRITPVRPQDLPEILALQKAAFESEARLVGNWNIPPLTQTLQELTDDWQKGVMLKGVDAENLLVGSVRAVINGASANIGRLMVLPRLQGQGYGFALLQAVESVCEVNRFELFTSSLSVKNLRLYEKSGYKPFRQAEAMPGVTLVWLEKFRNCT